MALPAGRYGVTKNQLLKIKKLPMNTIKLIEELTEKFDLLGTAAFKNSTSVVTQSTDLVESGAVKDIVGWGNKNLLPYFTETKTGSGTLSVIPSNGRYSFTGTAGGASAIMYPVTVPINSGVYRFVADGYEHVEGSNISLYYNDNGTTKALAPDETIDLSIYAITAIAFFAGANNSVNYLNIGLMLVKESESDKSFEPYHASVEESLAEKTDNTVIAPVENGTNPTKSYAIGEHFIRNGKFCTVTVAVTTSSTWVLNGNYVEGDVASVLSVSESALTDVIGDVSTTKMGNHLYKYGNVVEMDLSVTNVTCSAFANLAVIPEGYRPANGDIRFYDVDGRAYKTYAGGIQPSVNLSNNEVQIHTIWITN